jgi:hypothetical protein
MVVLVVLAEVLILVGLAWVLVGLGVLWGNRHILLQIFDIVDRRALLHRILHVGS